MQHRKRNDVKKQGSEQIHEYQAKSRSLDHVKTCVKKEKKKEEKRTWQKAVIKVIPEYVLQPFGHVRTGTSITLHRERLDQLQK